MIVAFAVGALSVGLLLASWFLRARSGLRTAVVVVLALAGLTAWGPARVAAAAATYNPSTGSQGFAVFVQGNAALGASSAWIHR
jgi:hypothetical protein